MIYEEIILSVVAFIGSAGIIATSLTYYFDKRKQIKLNEQQLKEKRYQHILALMCSHLNPEYTGYFDWEGRKSNPNNFKKELEVEWFYSVLFASDDFVKALKEFIQKPDNTTYAKAVIAMRKDLWNEKTNLKPEVINL